MTKSMLSFIGMLMVALGVQPALAENRGENVGATSIMMINRSSGSSHCIICVRRSSQAHICMSASSDIILSGGVIGLLPPDLAWIHPTIVGVGPEGGVVDACGRNSIPERQNALSCSSWTDASPLHAGFSLTSTGALRPSASCLVEFPAACCAALKVIPIIPPPDVPGPR